MYESMGRMDAVLVDDVAQVGGLISKEVALLHRQLQPGVAVRSDDGADLTDVGLRLRAMGDTVVKEADDN